MTFFQADARSAFADGAAGDLMRPMPKNAPATTLR